MVLLGPNLIMTTKLLLLALLIPVLGVAQNPDTTARPADSARVAKVEIESTYPGGLAGWRRYLITNMHYPVKAMKKNIQGTVIVQFIVELDGSVSNVEAVEGPQMLMDESVRLIKESGKWIPARQNGKPVKSYKKQPFVYRLENR